MRKKPKKPIRTIIPKGTKWNGHRIALADRVDENGNKIVERALTLGVIMKLRKGIRYWLLKSEAKVGEGAHCQELVMCDDTLDALVKAYYMHRGTMAVEIEWRIAAGTVLPKEKADV